MKKHVLFLFATLLSLAASAEKVKIDGIWYNLITETHTAKVTSSDDIEYSGSITIPATVTHEGVDYNVTSIGNSAFIGCSITAINIPESVTSIGSYAFMYCSSLTAITLPEGVTSIGDYAFSNCYGLTSITIPENSQLTSIGERAFQYCTSLTAITLPESVTSIGREAFFGCSNLCNVRIYAEEVPSTGEYPFGAYAILTVPSAALENYKITAPWGYFAIIKTFETQILKEVDELSNEKLYYVAQPYRNATSWAVETGGTSMKSNNELGITVDSSDPRQQFAFITPDNGDTRYLYHPAEKKFVCKNGSLSTTPVDAVFFKDGAYAASFVVYFDNEHYINVNGISQMVINSWSYADGGNSSVILPVGDFDPAEALKAFQITTNVSLNETKVTLSVGEESTLIATVVSENDAELTVTWSTSNSDVVTVSEGVVTAVAPGAATITATANDGSGVSAQCEVTVTRTAKVEIDDIWYNLVPKAKTAEVTYKGDDPYQGGWYSGSITLPTTITYDGVQYSVTSIGEYAFRSCSSLTTITIPEGVTSIGYEAFYECFSLTAIVLPEKLKSVGSKAFANCTKLLDVYCYAETVPGTYTDAFDGSDIEYATLHVPERAVESYKSITPWCNFGKIVPLTDTDAGIENSEIRNENSTLIYDLNGRRVAHPMKSGIYIIGSKKVVIK